MTSGPTHLAEPQRVLGKYHIVRPLKLGGTAAIYLAVLRGENNFSREVVIKRPLPHLVADRRSRLMFIDEAHIAARLSHPNICQVLDLVARDDETYLVLEYLRGVDLREVLKRCFELNRYLPPEVAVWIASEVAAGLDFAHEAVGLDGQPLNLVHRDVSPKNIRITFAGAVKVIDFGIARAENRATETAAGTIKGTLGYMSPEQILGDTIDRRSDIFAFGIVLFQMLTSRNPFDGATLKERVRKLTHAPIPDVREMNGALDEEIAAIVKKCLERDVELRYGSMREVQADLEHYLGRLQVVSPRQRLVRYLEELFPASHEIDPELKIALTEVSSITGKIDSEIRLRFPDDPPTEAQGATAATQRADGSERPTMANRGQTPATVAPQDTRPLIREADTAYGKTRLTPPAEEPKSGPPWKWIGFGVGAVVLAAGLVLSPLVKGREEPIKAESLATTEKVVTTENEPKPDAAVKVEPPPPTPVEPPKTVVRKVERPSLASPERSRLFYRAGAQLAKQGRTDDARLLYQLAHGFGGNRPDPAILLNLGLLYNRDKNAPKAKACLAAYLERRPDAPEAGQVRTLISSFPPVATVACVDAQEEKAAERAYSRQGAAIDGWVDEALEKSLR